ncbi:MAG: four helix bundle protein [Bacteroidetes bacterium]|nr:four helix bundle protein [Bacteroidota bacterium]
MIKQFEDLEVWKLSRELVKRVYLLTAKDNISKDYRFCNQIQSAIVSIMNNIAEGFERRSNKEFIQFLFIAKGSCGELRSLNYVALDINYISQDEFNEINESALLISKSLSGFIKYLKKSV